MSTSKAMRIRKTIYLASAISLLLVACGDDGDPNALRGKNNGDPNGQTPPGEQPPGQDPNDPALCKSKEYAGFDNLRLDADRKAFKLGEDRGRVKPFGALQTEYARVLGAAPASLQGSGATFGQVPKNWYEEPEANAVALQTAYNIAFDGCLTFTATAPEFEKAPDATSAAAQCGAMARKFWSKTPGPQEIQACADVAVTGAAKEPAARRKWAYACASVLTSAGFLTY
jgi:hypothetical protein